jgi:hypothetical protein
MGKIVEVKFNAIVEDDFLEEFEKIIDHKIDCFLNLSEFPEIGSVYYARATVLGDNNVGNELGSVNEKEEPEDKKISYKEESKEQNSEVMKDITNLFGGYGHIENTNITLNNIGNEKYTICFIKNTVKGKDTFDKIVKKFTEVISKEKIFFNNVYVCSDSDRYGIIIYTSGASWLSTSLIGNRDNIAGLERILKEVTREFGNVGYIIEVDNTRAYTNSNEV